MILFVYLQHINQHNICNTQYSANIGQGLWCSFTFQNNHISDLIIRKQNVKALKIFVLINATPSSSIIFFLSFILSFNSQDYHNWMQLFSIEKHSFLIQFSSFAKWPLKKWNDWSADWVLIRSFFFGWSLWIFLDAQVILVWKHWTYFFYVTQRATLILLIWIHYYIFLFGILHWEWRFLSL